MILMPPPPDPVVILSLLTESIMLGHETSEEGFDWCVENGYIEMVDDESFRVLDAGREHVASKIIYPGLN